MAHGNRDLRGYWTALTIIGLPIAFWIFNRIPSILTVRPRTSSYAVEVHNGVAYLTERDPDAALDADPGGLVRACRLVARRALWIAVAYLLALTVIGLPIGLRMFNRVGGAMTLLRY